MWGRGKASEGAARWGRTGGGGLLVRGLIKGGERDRERESARFFILAQEAYLATFPQTDRQVDRERDRQDTLARLKSFIPPNPGRSLLS